VPVRPTIADGADAAPSDVVAERARTIVAEFAALDDWLDRYRYLVAMGERMPRLAEEQRTEENRLRGCQYGLWLVSDYDANAGVLHFRVDSDAKIPRGLAALVLRVLDRQPPAVIATAELGFLDALGLGAHLSAQRSEGLAAMIHELKRRALSLGDAHLQSP